MMMRVEKEHPEWVQEFLDAVGGGAVVDLDLDTGSSDNAVIACHAGAIGVRFANAGYICRALYGGEMRASLVGFVGQSWHDTARAAVEANAPNFLAPVATFTCTTELLSAVGPGPGELLDAYETGVFDGLTGGHGDSLFDDGGEPVYDGCVLAEYDIGVFDGVREFSMVRARLVRERAEALRNG